MAHSFSRESSKHEDLSLISESVLNSNNNKNPGMVLDPFSLLQNELVKTPYSLLDHQPSLNQEALGL